MIATAIANAIHTEGVEVTLKKYNKITAAEGDSSKLAEAIDLMKDDFDYILSGLEKLDRSGAEASNQGLVIAERLQTALEDAISDIGEQVAD